MKRQEYQYGETLSRAGTLYCIDRYCVDGYPPEHPVRAISRQQTEKVNLEIVTNRDIIKDEKLIELQIWAYDPKFFTHNIYVDLMSLYVSLKEEPDERAEHAHKLVLRDAKWYTDYRNSEVIAS